MSIEHVIDITIIDIIMSTASKYNVISFPSCFHVTTFNTLLQQWHSVLACALLCRNCIDPHSIDIGLDG